MSKVFTTSDTHYFHNNIIKYCNRPFSDIEEMSEKLIENWNAVVAPDDIVYHLGDVAMGGKNRADQLCNILYRLNGTINLIKGNHDNYLLKHEGCLNRFATIKDYLELNYEGRLFVIQHFPLLVWNQAGKTNKDGQPYSIHLHGHSHGGVDHINASTTRMDVGVDSHQYVPITLDAIIKIMDDRTYQSIDHHNSNTSHY